jgi:hypothetical protein
MSARDAIVERTPSLAGRGLRLTVSDTPLHSAEFLAGDAAVLRAGYDESGAEISTNSIAGGCTQANLNPSQACGVIAPSKGVRLAYCRIQVPLGSKLDVRGSLYGSTQNGVSAAVVPAE